MPKRKEIDKDLLYDLYYNQELTAKEICKILNIRQPITIYQYMDKYGFKRRDANKIKKSRTMHGLDDIEFEFFLRDASKNKSITKIAQSLGVSFRIIKKYMDMYGIEYLDHKKACSKYNKNNKNNFKGGRTSHGDGYTKVLNPDHPRSNKNGYVLEHILIAEKKIGRPLTSNEVVHHINGIKDDNRPENLLVLTKSEHSALHKNGTNHYHSMEQIRRGWS